MTTLTTLSSTLSHNQWIHPLAMQCGSDLYVGAVRSNNGNWYVQKYNGSVSSTIVKTGFETDDHNAVAVLARPGKDVLAFYTRHNQGTVIYRGRAASGTNSFADDGTLNYSAVGSAITYAQVLDYNDDLYLFTRVSDSKWAFRKSTDWGNIYSGAQVFIDDTGYKVYVMFTPSEDDPDYYNLAIVRNPAEDSSILRYGKVNITNGDIYANGSVIGNLSGTNLPLGISAFEEVYTPQRSYQRVRLWDVGDKYGQPVLLYELWESDCSEGGTTGNIGRYIMAVKDPTSGAWERKDLDLSAGRPFYASDTSHYTPGMGLDRNGNNTLFASWRSTGNNFYLMSYDIDSDFKLSNPVQLDYSNTQMIARPYPVIGRSAAVYEKINSYTDYHTYSSGTNLVDV